MSQVLVGNWESRPPSYLSLVLLLSAGLFVKPHDDKNDREEITQKLHARGASARILWENGNCIEDILPVSWRSFCVCVCGYVNRLVCVCVMEGGRL